MKRGNLEGDSTYIKQLHGEGKSTEKIQAELPWHTLKHIDKVIRRDVLQGYPGPQIFDRPRKTREDEVVRDAIVEAQQRPLTHQQLIKELVSRMPARSSLELEARVAKLRKDAVEESTVKQLPSVKSEEGEQRSGTSAANDTDKLT